MSQDCSNSSSFQSNPKLKSSLPWDPGGEEQTSSPSVDNTNDFDNLTEQVYSSTISANTKLEILCQAVGTCPQVSLQFGEQSLPALSDSGSEVTLV